MLTKKEIRRKALKKRMALGESLRQRYSREITGQVIGHPFFQCADEIYCYVSFREEVDTTALIEAAWKFGKRVAVPRVTGKRTMQFYYIDSMESLRAGYHGIPEPVPALCKEAEISKSGSTFSEKTLPCLKKERMPLMIVPGAAFDPAGNRIGYGGGFYDTYLYSHPECRTLGIAFSVQCTNRISPEEHDVCMDAVLTEAGELTFYVKRNGNEQEHTKGERKMSTGLPQDPVMLLSVINMKLRDSYASLDILCEELELSKEALTEKLERIDYRYDSKQNQFI